MSNKTDFERQLMALDRDKLVGFLLDTVGMYVEWIEVHGYEGDAAKFAAVNEMINGTEATIELDDAGEL